MKADNPNDDVWLHLVVEGVEPLALKRLHSQFDSIKGGARPHDRSLYASIPVGEDTIDETIKWVYSELDGMFQSSYVEITVHTKLSWAEVTVPMSVSEVACRHGAELKVIVMTPAISQRLSDVG